MLYLNGVFRQPPPPEEPSNAAASPFVGAMALAPRLRSTTGDQMTVDVTTGAILSLTTGLRFQAAPFPRLLEGSIRKGGVVFDARRCLAGGTLRKSENFPPDPLLPRLRVARLTVSLKAWKNGVFVFRWHGLC